MPHASAVVTTSWYGPGGRAWGTDTRDLNTSAVSAGFYFPDKRLLSRGTWHCYLRVDGRIISDAAQRITRAGRLAVTTHPPPMDPVFTIG
jgi:hypothetical protein